MRDCGLQMLTIPGSGGGTYPYSAVLSVTTQTLNTDSFTLSLSATLNDQVGTYNPTIKVAFVNWPSVTLTTSPFVAEIGHPCRVATFVDQTISNMYAVIYDDAAK